jgi:rhamnosyltransferase
VFNCYSVIVCYNPDWDNVFKLVATLQSSGVKSIVIDNSDIHYQLNFKPDFYYVPLNGNFGIAAAQNIGVQKALSLESDIIIFFDQDSAIDDTFIQRLLKPIIDENKNIVAPVFRSIQYGFIHSIVSLSRFGFRIKTNPLMMSNLTTNMAISSGSAIHKDVFESVGLFEEKLFIDYVDTEWCLRCYSKGYNIFIDTSVEMLHEIGDRTISFLSLNVPVHTPLRRYFRLRNAIQMLRYRHVPKLYAITEILYCLIHHTIIMFSSKNKLEYFKSLIQALKDGILGKLGSGEYFSNDR